MELSDIAINAKIEELRKSLEVYAGAAQAEINTKRTAIQTATNELQELVKQAQREVDRREGAMEQLKELLTKEVPLAPASANSDATVS